MHNIQPASFTHSHRVSEHDRMTNTQNALPFNIPRRFSKFRAHGRWITPTLVWGPKMHNTDGILPAIEHGKERKWLRRVALAATVATGITTTLSQPFFPDYAARKYKVSAATVGLIAAGCPSAQVVSTLLWTWLMGRVGRRVSLLLGSLILTTGTVIFALSQSVACFTVGRILQGIGSQGAYASSIALIMEISETLAMDMGTIEFTWGLGYMLGPPLGGVTYHFTGFALAHAPAACLTILIAVLCLFIICRWGANASITPGDSVRGNYSPLADSPLEDEDTEEEGHQAQNVIDQEAVLQTAGSRAGQGWSRLFNWSVFAVSLGIIGHAAVQGFKEITLAKHLALSLGANSALSGTVFMLEPLVYSVVCIVIGHVANNELLQSRVMLGGLVVYALGLYGLAVPCFFTEVASQGRVQLSSASPWLRVPLAPSGEWLLVLLSLTLMVLQ